MLLLTAGASAQSLGYGIKLGVPFTDVFANGGLNENSHFAIGPMIEFRLPIIGFEADALYHNVSLHRPTTLAQPLNVGSGNTWQFPIVGKVRLPTTPILKPYGEVGVSFRTFSGSGPDLGSPSKKGFVLGAGLDIHAIVIHITPELRFTRWGSGHPIFLQANDNQFEFLVGFSR
jgi:hypothetical protein